MVRDQRYKIVVHHGFELGELYDLTADPNETCNPLARPGLCVDPKRDAPAHLRSHRRDGRPAAAAHRALVRPAPAVRLIAPMRREFNVILAWSVDRLGRSLQDMVAFLS
jgi:hypothetical protein